MENFEILLIILTVIWLFGKLFRAFNLPIIFGELLGGIVVGPLVLNLVNPESEVVVILAELGIFFLMLHSGLETDPKKLYRASKRSILIALGGVVFPFLGGYLVSRYFGQSFESSIFIGMGLCTTAIAISVRLFKECNIQKTEVAHIALGAAIISDILVLIVFSIILTITNGESIILSDILFLLFKIVSFFILTLFIGHKASKYLPGVLLEKGFSLTLIAALVLGLLAELIGLHIILGAFLAGLFIQERVLDEKIYRKIEDRIYGLSYSFLGPIFFVSLAFHLDFVAIKEAPWFLLVIFLVAFFGKLFGSGIMAFFQKIEWKKSVLIGIAMNSRGAVDLVIASIGLQKGIIEKNVFSILVLVAFMTTLVSVFTMRKFSKLIIKN